MGCSGHNGFISIDIKVLHVCKLQENMLSAWYFIWFIQLEAVFFPYRSFSSLPLGCSVISDPPCSFSSNSIINIVSAAPLPYLIIFFSSGFPSRSLCLSFSPSRNPLSSYYCLCYWICLVLCLFPNLMLFFLLLPNSSPCVSEFYPRLTFACILARHSHGSNWCFRWSSEPVEECSSFRADGGSPVHPPDSIIIRV